MRIENKAAPSGDPNISKPAAVPVGAVAAEAAEAAAKPARPNVPAPYPGPPKVVKQRAPLIIKVRKRSDGTLHDCLFESVHYARVNGYEIADQAEYEAAKARRANYVAEGETVAPVTAGENVRVFDGRKLGRRSEDDSGGDTHSVPLRHD